MSSGLLVKLRPTTPWRIGSDNGTRDRVESVYHSDSVYSAVTSAMASLGQLDAWLDSTARNPGGTSVRFSSCYPYHDNRRYVIPPRNLWPPAPSARVRWQGARFVPLSIVELLLRGKSPDDERWCVDGLSECLVPTGSHGPFRQSVRSRAAVDRIHGRTEVHGTACLEFVDGAGLWLAIEFASSDARERWEGPVRSAFRLLADSGFGGRRSGGWGRTAEPEFTAADLPGAILQVDQARATETAANDVAPEREPEWAWWLLSVFAPAGTDTVNWRRGTYNVLERGGRVESAAGWGRSKKSVKMIEEGSVLLAGSEPQGMVLDVSPDGFAHPVFRAGFALAIRMPWRSPYGEPGQRPTRVPKPETAPAPPPPEPEPAPPVLSARVTELLEAPAQPAGLLAAPDVREEPATGAPELATEPQPEPEVAAPEDTQVTEVPAEPSPEPASEPDSPGETAADESAPREDV